MRATTSDNGISTGIREVTDLYGRRYHVGLSPEDISGHSRRVQLWAAWACMVVISPLQYSFGVAVPGLQESHGWGHTSTVWLLAVFVACQAGVAVPVSWLHRSARLSARQLVVVGGLLSGVGLLSLASVDSYVGTLIGYSLVGGVGAGMLYTTCLTTTARWFPDRRVAMSGFVTGGFACGAVPTVALIDWLGEPGIGLVFALAGLAAMVVVPWAGRLLADPPPHWWPSHIDAQAWAVDRRLNSSLPRNVPAARLYSPADALRTGVLPQIWLVLASISAVSLLPVALVASFAITSEVGAWVAGLSAGLLAGVNGLARAAAGRLSDRFGRRHVLAAVLAVEGCALFGLVLSANLGSGWGFVVSAACAGLGGGAFYPIVGNVVLEFFGDRSLLQNQAIVYSAKAVGGLAGIGAAAVCVAHFGYGPVFVAAGLIGLGTAGLVRFLKQPGRPALPVRPQLGRPTVSHHGSGR